MATADRRFLAVLNQLNQQRLHGKFPAPLYNRQGASGDDT